MTTVFFFARYWRRAEILTDVELVEIRYAGKPAAFLRGIQGGVPRAPDELLDPRLGHPGDGRHHGRLSWARHCQGRVLRPAVGGHALLHYTLGEPRTPRCFICIFMLVPFTGVYTFLGGLWGVLVTDLFQFDFKMTMIVVLAWIAVVRLGGMSMLVALSHRR